MDKTDDIFPDEDGFGLSEEVESKPDINLLSLSVGGRKRKRTRAGSASKPASAARRTKRRKRQPVIEEDDDQDLDEFDQEEQHEAVEEGDEDELEFKHNIEVNEVSTLACWLCLLDRLIYSR